METITEISYCSVNKLPTVKIVLKFPEDFYWVIKNYSRKSTQVWYQFVCQKPSKPVHFINYGNKLDIFSVTKCSFNFEAICPYKGKHWNQHSVVCPKMIMDNSGAPYRNLMQHQTYLRSKILLLGTVFNVFLPVSIYSYAHNKL